jgi:hypothetical protein
MKTIKFALALLAFSIVSHLATAQSSAGAKQAFKVSLKIGPRYQLEQTSFTAYSGKRLKATILDKKALDRLKLRPGTIVQGTFRFSKLSGTDLDSSRFYEGWGNFAFDKVMKPDGQVIGCPPLCEDAVRLKVRVRE